MLKRFAYHGVTVSDLDRSVAFYRDLLHMKVERTYEAAGVEIEKATGIAGARTKVVMLRYSDDFGDHLLKLIQWLTPEGKKRFEARLCDVGASHTDICLDRVQRVYDELTHRGVRFISPPVRPFPKVTTAGPRGGEPGGNMFTYMLDPDGIVVELHRRMPHHHHVISDLDRAVVFYRDILGMSVDCIVDISGPGIAEGTGLPGAHLRSAHMVLDTVEYVELHHYVRPEGKKRSEMRLCDVGCSHVAFEVDDVQQSYQELKAKGVRFLSAPVKLKAEVRAEMVYMHDQDDYILELRPAGAPL
ncbi:MAG: VOC family protein [Chloroflexi bacterium]|nr:VOC family protein [Chloroflexota bacterium]